jgi:hypothetical protein
MKDILSEGKNKAGLPLGAQDCLQQRGPQDVQLFHTILFQNYPAIILLVYLHT